MIKIWINIRKESDLVECERVAGMAFTIRISIFEKYSDEKVHHACEPFGLGNLLQYINNPWYLEVDYVLHIGKDSNGDETDVEH